MNNSLSLSHLAVVFSSNRALVLHNPFACFPYLMRKGTPDFGCHSPYAGVWGCFRVDSCRFLCFLRALHGMPRYRTMRAVWRTAHRAVHAHEAAACVAPASSSHAAIPPASWFPLRHARGNPCIWLPREPSVGSCFRHFQSPNGHLITQFLSSLHRIEKFCFAQMSPKNGKKHRNEGWKHEIWGLKA